LKMDRREESLVVVETAAPKSIGYFCSNAVRLIISS
jgi:hypothetical protein